jgi:hypothetical protein
MAVERGGLAVLLRGRALRAGRLGGAPDRGAVDLLAVEEALARPAGHGGHALAVLVHGVRVVGGQAAEVERFEGPGRDAAPARREERLRGREVGDQVVALPAERGFSRQHRPQMLDG